MTDCGIGGVYRDDGLTPTDALGPELAPSGAAPALGKVPGLVPFGVTRPPVLRLGGATRKRVYGKNAFDTTTADRAGCMP